MNKKLIYIFIILVLIYILYKFKPKKDKKVETNTNTNDYKSKYVIDNFNNAKLAGKKYGIDPLIILTQGGFESGYGTSNLAKNSFNFFGITAFGSKNEYWDGSFYQAKNKYALKFRVYKNALNCFYDYARLISSKYSDVLKKSKNYKEFAKNIANSPYISEANGDNRKIYENSLIKIYEFIQNVVKNNNLK